MDDTSRRVTDFYNKIAEDYHRQYDRELLRDTSRPYPANYFRLQLLLNSFARENIRRVVEVGVWEGTPFAAMVSAGIEVWGFDISEAMVEKSREKARNLGMDETRIFWGDIRDPLTYERLLKGRSFDGLVAMGVMPHIENDDMVLENMAALVKPGGSVFVEFRNKLFSLFTFNRYTYDFIINDLLADVDEKMKRIVADELNRRVRMDMPPPPDGGSGLGKTGTYSILAKFHNPFEATEMFRRHGFDKIQLLWYHYHPAQPWLEDEDRDLFRSEAMKLEHEQSGWRGLFLCSAFVVQAVKK